MADSFTCVRGQSVPQMIKRRDADTLNGRTDRKNKQ